MQPSSGSRWPARPCRPCCRVGELANLQRRCAGHRTNPGAKDNSFTAGEISAKVVCYAERIHHPDRLTRPMRQRAPKGSGDFVRFREDALDMVAEAFLVTERRHAPRDDVALLLRRNDETRHARPHKSASPRQAVLQRPLGDLRVARPGAGGPRGDRQACRDRFWNIHSLT